MENQKLEKIEKLDFYAAKALEILAGWKYPELKIAKSDRNVFIGSGNADNTGKLFAEKFGGFSLNVCNFRKFFRQKFFINMQLGHVRTIFDHTCDFFNTFFNITATCRTQGIIHLHGFSKKKAPYNASRYNNNHDNGQDDYSGT